jgi:hypothetical protein
MPSHCGNDHLWVGLDEVNTLLDVLLEVTKAGLEKLLLMASQLANRVDLLDTVGAKLDVGSEEVNALVLVERRVDESRLNNTLLTLSSTEKRLGEASTGHSHGESGRASAVLGLDDLITTELDAVDQVVELLAGDIGVTRLGDQGDDGDTGVTANDSDVLISWVGALDLGDEAGRADDIESGNTEQTLGVVDALALEDLGADGDGRVDLRTVSLCVDELTREHTGLEMTRTLASGAASATALARSRTMLALVLKRSKCVSNASLSSGLYTPSLVMPGLRGTPAGMRTISAP